MLVIDGSMGEGGGQILRYSLTLSALLGKPIKIVNIRAKRQNPGLQPQHLTSVKAVATLSNAEVEGAFKGSMQLVFKPRTLKGGLFTFDVGTAGSVTLVLQSLLPLLPFLDRETVIEIKGGTDVPMSPPIDYVRYVLIPLLRMMNFKIDLQLIRRGHYPRGGGVIRIYVTPTRFIEPIDLVERGSLHIVGGRSHCVKLPSHVAERQAKAAKDYLMSKGVEVPIDIEIESYEPDKDPHLGPGSGIVLYAKHDRAILGGDSLGAKGKSAETVGIEAAQKLYAEIASGATVDKHAGDMLVPLMGLAKGVSRIIVSEISSHMRTAIEVLKIFLHSEIRIQKYSETVYLVEIKGLGLER